MCGKDIAHDRLVPDTASRRSPASRNITRVRPSYRDTFNPFNSGSSDLGSDTEWNNALLPSR
jgi:hypothetical protein